MDDVLSAVPASSTYGNAIARQRASRDLEVTMLLGSPSRAGISHKTAPEQGLRVGLGGIEPPTSALSVRTKGLVRQLVYPATCRFVPRRAIEGRGVPLRLGTLWARPDVDRTAMAQYLLGAEDNVIPLTRAQNARPLQHARPRRPPVSVLLPSRFTLGVCPDEAVASLYRVPGVARRWVVRAVAVEP